jgi:hypothetical protein
MHSVRLNQGLRRLEITNIEIANEVVFSYFDSLPAEARDDAFKKALQIGVLALSQERLSAFLAKTENELGTELESLKIRLDMSAEIFSRSAVKGVAGEIAVAEYLAEFLASRAIGDSISPMGNAAGHIPKNKTGDILCLAGGDENQSIVIECKFDKNIAMGDLADRDWYGKNFDSALSQLLEAQANRRSKQAIIILDRSSVNPALLKRVENVSYRPHCGFIVIIDILRGDFSNLGLAYLIARDLVTSNREVEFDSDILTLLIERVVSEINRISDIKKLVDRSIKTSEEIIAKLDQGTLSIEFCRSYLMKFLSEGRLSKEDMFNFAAGGDLRLKYQAIASEILKDAV